VGMAGMFRLRNSLRPMQQEPHESSDIVTSAHARRWRTTVHSRRSRREPIGPSDSMVSLAALAAQVPDIRFGTPVTAATFRHPSMLAIYAANIDDISRFDLGIGTGWYEAEHTAYGLDFGNSFGERFDRMTEQLEILTGLWATPVSEKFSHDGKHYQLRDAPGLPKPVQRDGAGRPKVPLVLGGHGPKRTPALAARFAADYNVGFADVATTTAGHDRVRAACSPSVEIRTN